MKLSIICLLAGVFALFGSNEAKGKFDCYRKFPRRYFKDTTLKTGETYDNAEREAYQLCELDDECMGFSCKVIGVKQFCALGSYLENEERVSPGQKNFRKYLIKATENDGDRKSYWSHIKKDASCIREPIELGDDAANAVTIVALEERPVCPFREFCFVEFSITDANGDSVEDKSAEICKLVAGKQAICKEAEIVNGVYSRKIGGPNWNKASFTEGEWILTMEHDGEEVVSDQSVTVRVPPIKIVAKEEDISCQFREDCFVEFTIEDLLGNSVEAEETKICKLVDEEQMYCRKPEIIDGVYSRKIGGPNWKQESFTVGEWILVMDHEGEEFVPVRSVDVTFPDFN